MSGAFRTLRGLKPGVPIQPIMSRRPPSTGRYVIRQAHRSDGPAFLRLVTEFARFERLSPPRPAARQRLLRDAFGRPPSFELVLAEHRPSLRVPREVVAYAVVLRTYSTFLAKPTLYLEDIYLTPAHRRKGLGDRMMRYLARLARRRGWGRIEGIVLTWNRPARRFYKALGAIEKGDWIFFRFDSSAVSRLGRGR